VTRRALPVARFILPLPMAGMVLSVEVRTTSPAWVWTTRTAWLFC